MSMINEHINDIANMILADQCIFFCGAGLSAIDGKQPNTEKIVEFFIDDMFGQNLPFGFNRENLLSFSLPEIAQLYYEYSPIRDEQRLADYISFNFLLRHIKRDVIPSTTHLLLASLGLRDIYTTNYDCLIETAHTSVGFPNVNIIDDEYQIDNIDLHGLPNIYKLCGTTGNQNVTILRSQFQKTIPNRLHYPFMRRALDKSIVFYWL